MSLDEKNRRVLNLYELRRKISAEITTLEREIERDVRAMKRAREDAMVGLPTPTDEMRAGHASYVRGLRDEGTCALERQYQSLIKRRRRALKAQTGVAA